MTDIKTRLWNTHTLYGDLNLQLGFWLEERLTLSPPSQPLSRSGMLRPKNSHKPFLMWKCPPINVVLLTPRISLPLHISLFAHPSISHLWCLRSEAGALHKEKCLLRLATDSQGVWERLRFVSLMSVPARNCTSTQRSLRESASLLGVFHTQSQRKCREPNLQRVLGSTLG